MNPTLVAAIIQQVVTYLPLAVSEGLTVLREVPDIVAKGKQMVTDFKSGNVGTGVADIEGIVSELWLGTQENLSTIVSKATTSTPAAAHAATSAVS